MLPATLGEQAERALIEELRTTGELERFPLPKEWYKKYNIPLPRPMNFKEFANSGYWYKAHFDPNVAREIKAEPATGGVRPVLEIEPVVAETITKPMTEKSASENQQETHETTVCSTESNDSERQQS